MMTYSDLMKRLFKVNFDGGIKLGLENCRRLQKALKFPTHHFQSIHVAGTNGKGSVVTKIALGLQVAGYQTGLFTSPHLSCFRERIRVNGEMISEQAIEELLPFLFDLIQHENIPATFFEITTFLAFLYFKQMGVQMAVLETGLGGRMDATNIVHPILTVITSISLDHTDILGTTLEAITREKGGIIKPSVPVIIGPQVPLSIIQEIAYSQNSPCIPITQQEKHFESENRLIAKTALNYLSTQISISQQAIGQGLEGKQPCRFEILYTPSPVILDVAHNPDGLLRLFEYIQDVFPQIQLHILFGLSKNKDIKSCLKILAQQGKFFYPVEAMNERGIPIKELEEGLKQFHIDEERIKLCSDIRTSFYHAYSQANLYREGLVVCGSFFIMSPIRQALGIQEPRDEIDLNERHLKKLVG
jgi:dihydrofolate synthase/folylpolyglutamate synthase